MNVLSYENYCLKVKLQELLEKMANIQNGKPSSPTISSPMRDEKLENEYKEIINKKDLEIEYLKDMVATLTANIKEEPHQSPPTEEKFANYEATIATYQEQHNLLHENIKKHEDTIANYQEQHKLLHEESENHKNTIANLEEQYKLLHDTHMNNEAELHTKKNEIETLINALHEEREQFKAIIIGKDAEISIYKK
jgi:chromosome segregation ATPase